MQSNTELESNINDAGITYFDYNEFKIIRTVGEGGFGKVYEAEITGHHSHGYSVVALKKFKKDKKDLSESSDFIKEV